MSVQWDETQTFFVEAAGQRFNFGRVEEKAAGAFGVVVGWRVFGLVGGNLGIQKPRFVVF